MMSTITPDDREMARNAIKNQENITSFTIGRILHPWLEALEAAEARADQAEAKLDAFVEDAAEAGCPYRVMDVVVSNDNCPNCEGRADIKKCWHAYAEYRALKRGRYEE